MLKVLCLAGDFLFWGMLKAFFNSQLIDAQQPIVSAENQGLLFGDGLFETILISSGRPVLWKEHLYRLKSGLSLLQLELFQANPQTQIETQIAALIKLNQISQGRLRLTVFRGEFQTTNNTNVNAHLLIQAWPINYKPALNQEGLTLAVYDLARKSSDAFSSIKHNNFMPNTMGMRFAQKNHAADALILNPSGRVCETCMANIWMIKNGEFKTPAISEGPIAGIMRSFLIRHLSKNNIPVVESQITLDELKDADELFISNSMRIINWVETLEGKTYSNKLSGELFHEIINRYPETFH